MRASFFVVVVVVVVVVVCVCVCLFEYSHYLFTLIKTTCRERQQQLRQIAFAIKVFSQLKQIKIYIYMLLILV